MDETQEITGRGGKRPGAGRPKGRKTLVGIKKAILEYTSPQELENLVKRAKKMAEKDKVVLMWYLEQVFGKAKAVNQLPAGKTVNNIAVFLDSLEKQTHADRNRVITVTPEHDRISDAGRETLGQAMEIEPSLQDN